MQPSYLSLVSKISGEDHVRGGEAMLLFRPSPLSSEGRVGDLDSIGDPGDESENGVGEELRTWESDAARESYKNVSGLPLILHAK